MAGASTSLTLVDRLTGPLTKMMRAMDRTIAIMERMDRAANDVDTRGLQRARRDIQNASADLERLRSSSTTDRLSEGFRRIRSPVNRATDAVRGFFASFAGAAAAYLSIQGLANGFKKFVGASDAMVSTSARLSLINDGLQTQAELQDKIYYAAQRSLTPYNNMADSVAKLNLLAGHAFSGNDETIRFSELMGKALSVSGADTQARQAATRQLTQAMSSGRLQGDEYVSIIENAPLLAQAIEKAMGQGEGSLKKLSSEGKITSAVIKSALFSAGAEIEEMFASLPLTFADAMVLFRNWSGRAFEPLYIRFNQFVNSDAFGVLAGHAMWFVNVFIAGMTIMFNTLEKVYNEIGAIGSIIAQNWDSLGPIITAAGAALAGYLGIMAAVRLAALYAAASQALLNFQLAANAAVATAAGGATFFATAAQHGLNAAIYAFPGTWILLAFVAVIAFVIFAMIRWQDQTATVIGAIVGSIYWLGAVFYNVLMGIGNFIIATVELFVNLWNQGTYLVQMAFIGLNLGIWLVLDAIGNAALSVAEFFVNIWNQAIYMVQLGWIAWNLGVRMVLDAIGNAALKTAEWFINTWNDAVFGVQSAFHKMASFVLTILSGVGNGIVGVVNGALGAISNLINGAVKGINSFIGLLNGVLGTELSTIGTVDLKMSSGATSLIDNLQNNLAAPTKAVPASLGRMNTAGDYANSVTMPTAPKAANLGKVDNASRYADNVTMPSEPIVKSYDRLEYTSLGDAYAKGNAAGTALSLKASDKLSGALEKVTGLVKGGKDNPLVPGNIPNGDLANMVNPLGAGADDGKLKGGKLDKVGKIDKEIDISDEDIKMMRDLAEIKSIQNFVTLTPSVTFGDTTIREEADLDKLVQKVTMAFSADIERSAKGVFT